MRMSLSAACIAAAIVLSGCATERYGRLQPVTPAQAQALSCEDIAMDLIRVAGFSDQISVSGGFWPISAIADSSTGNDRERHDARLSAQARRDQLLAVQSAMECTV